MWLCKDNLKERTAHFWLPSASQKTRVVKLPIVLCSWARHFTLMVPLSTQVYKWVLANLHVEVESRSRNTPSRFMLQKLEVD